MFAFIEKLRYKFTHGTCDSCKQDFPKAELRGCWLVEMDGIYCQPCRDQAIAAFRSRIREGRIETYRKELHERYIAKQRFDRDLQLQEWQNQTDLAKMRKEFYESGAFAEFEKELEEDRKLKR